MHTSRYQQGSLGGTAVRLDPSLGRCRTPGFAGPGHAGPVVTLLGGVGRSASGQVFRGDGGGLSGTVGLLFCQLFLGRGDDDGDRNGEKALLSYHMIQISYIYRVYYVWFCLSAVFCVLGTAVRRINVLMSCTE